MERRLTTGPSSSSSSPSHLFAFFGATTAGVVAFFVVSSSEASQSDITKPTQRTEKRKGGAKESGWRLDRKFWSISSLRPVDRCDQRGLPNIPTSSRSPAARLRNAMSSMTRDALLKLALPLVKNHGFTRSTLSLAVMYSPSGSHTAPLNDTAVDALFGEGDEARRTLIHAWLDDARSSLRTSYSQGGSATSTTRTPSLENVLKTRLSKNEDVLKHLPEVSTYRSNSEVLTSFMRDSDPLRHSLSLPHPQPSPPSSSP